MTIVRDSTRNRVLSDYVRYVKREVEGLDVKDHDDYLDEIDGILADAEDDLQDMVVTILEELDKEVESCEKAYKPDS